MITLLNIKLVDNVVVIDFDYEGEYMKFNNAQFHLSPEEYIATRVHGDDGIMLEYRIEQPMIIILEK